MDIETLKAQVAELERKHAALHDRFVEALKLEGAYFRTIHELESKVQSLEARLKDLDQVEAAAFAAYAKTNDAAKAATDEMTEAVDRAAYFESLPTVKDYRKRNKQSPES